ncbi:hypothetical protein CNECB9_2540091 [Cupriavidus necator]|uniref:Uncharacterized protein n=1 Tax=Cupriavidus necator TaxID=106590 RepID=A0A1K0JD32_CUPNE|nr:hypothetical protein CNECB9_2540091 [Cupriavidus necator]
MPAGSPVQVFPTLQCTVARPRIIRISQ